MPALRTARFGACPSCRALNMDHRTRCYRCRGPLPESLWPEAARIVQVRPGNRSGPSEKRRSGRRYVQISGAVMVEEHLGQCRGTVRDISPGGLQFRSLAWYPVGSRVQIRLPLEGRVWLVEGTVRYVCPLEDNLVNCYASGIMFTQVGPDLKRLLERLA